MRNFHGFDLDDKISTLKLLTQRHSRPGQFTAVTALQQVYSTARKNGWTDVLRETQLAETHDKARRDKSRDVKEKQDVK